MPEGRPKKPRADQEGPHRVQFERNRKKILLTQEVCGICGKPVDKSLPFPHPLSPTVDHIIPIDRGGHPSAIENLQLAHFACNRQKSNMMQRQTPAAAAPAPMRMLPLSTDWTAYRG